MTSSQWFVLGVLVIFCWGGNKAFATYLDKHLELEKKIAHEKTLQKQIDMLEKLIKLKEG